jgi:hypothetical protein
MQATTEEPITPTDNIFSRCRALLNRLQPPRTQGTQDTAEEVTSSRVSNFSSLRALRNRFQHPRSQETQAIPATADTPAHHSDLCTFLFENGTSRVALATTFAATGDTSAEHDRVINEPQILATARFAVNAVDVHLLQPARPKFMHHQEAYICVKVINERRSIEEQYRKSPTNARRSEPIRLYLYRLR